MLRLGEADSEIGVGQVGVGYGGGEGVGFQSGGVEDEESGVNVERVLSEGQYILTCVEGEIVAGEVSG